MSTGRPLPSIIFEDRNRDSAASQAEQLRAIECVEQRLCVFEIGRVETLREPAVDQRVEKGTRLSRVRYPDNTRRRIGLGDEIRW